MNVPKRAISWEVNPLLGHLPTGLEPYGIGGGAPVTGSKLVMTEQQRRWIVPRRQQSGQAHLSLPEMDWPGTKSLRTETVELKTKIVSPTLAMNVQMLETNEPRFVRWVPQNIMMRLLPIARRLQEIVRAAPRTESGPVTIAERQRQTALRRKRIEKPPSR